MGKYDAQTAWNREHSTMVALKLNNKTDADIVEWLKGKAKQTEIKRLIREEIAREKKDATK